MAVEKVQGISRLEQLCEEFSEEERVRELKQEKKRQKRKNRRKNKCVCEIPAPLQAAEEKEINQAKVNMGSWGFLGLHPSLHPCSMAEFLRDFIVFWSLWNLISDEQSLCKVVTWDSSAFGVWWGGVFLTLNLRFRLCQVVFQLQFLKIEPGDSNATCRQLPLNFWRGGILFKCNDFSGWP